MLKNMRGVTFVGEEHQQRQGGVTFVDEEHQQRHW